jgi:hypothetical protein
MQVPSTGAAPVLGHVPQASFALGVAKKQRDATELEGRQAVALIESASAPRASSQANVGQKLDIVA